MAFVLISVKRIQKAWSFTRNISLAALMANRFVKRRFFWAR